MHLNFTYQMKKKFIQKHYLVDGSTLEKQGSATTFLGHVLHKCIYMK